MEGQKGVGVHVKYNCNGFDWCFWLLSDYVILTKEKKNYTHQELTRYCGITFINLIYKYMLRQNLALFLFKIEMFNHMYMAAVRK